MLGIVYTEQHFDTVYDKHNMTWLLNVSALCFSIEKDRVCFNSKKGELKIA
jgi:hypothetical protein